MKITNCIKITAECGCYSIFERQGNNRTHRLDLNFCLNHKHLEYAKDSRSVLVRNRISDKFWTAGRNLKYEEII